MGGYATVLLAPTMPIAMQRKKLLIGLLGLGVNSEFHYPNYFVIIPSGPDPKPSFTKGFIDLAMKQNPRPTTVAIVAADAEFALNAADGARENAKKAGLKIVYDRRYPPNTTDFAPIVRAIAATNPDLVVVCSYPPDSVGIVRSVNEINFRPKMIGGAHGRPAEHLDQGAARPAAQRLDQLRLLAAGAEDELPRRRRHDGQVSEARAGRRHRPLRLLHGAAGLRPVPGAGAGGRGDQEPQRRRRSPTTSARTRSRPCYGDIKFGKDGEWAESRVLQVQFRGIKNNDPAQFKGIDTQAWSIRPAMRIGERDLSVREGESLKIRRRVRIGAARETARRFFFWVTRAAACG